MKNYIANERGFWATSSGYIKFSFARAIHFGRLYTHGPNGDRGKDEHLSEALRCLGQGLHCLEDFGAHTNYTELVLRELGFTDVFPHTGVQTQMNLHGKHVFPLVTGTFGGVDFFHSVLGEATDHFTQTEIDQMDTTLSDALLSNKRSGDGSSPCSALTSALEKVPGTSGLIQEALDLQKASDAQLASNNQFSGAYDNGYGSSRAEPVAFDAPPGSVGGPPGPNFPGTNTDPSTIIPKIYPILAFRDKVVRSISNIISKIPGLEKLIETITERVTLFILSLLAPFVQPLIKAASQQLKIGSSAVIESSGKHQYEPWTDPYCTDPTHSLLSKDHFSNILNEPSGSVAATILQYVAPRVVYAWDHPDVPVDQVLNDVVRVFHHPAIRDPNCEIHSKMFDTVKQWVDSRPDRGASLNHILNSESVRAGKNHSGHNDHTHGQGDHNLPNFGGHSHGGGHGHGPPQSHGGGGHSHSHSGSGPSLNIPGLGNIGSKLPGSLSSALHTPFNMLSSRPRDFSANEEGSDPNYSNSRPGSSYNQPPHSPNWGSFQPYQSSYADGGQQVPEYQAHPPAGDSWGYYSGGQGSELSYSVPTAYQQGYENYNQSGQGGYGGEYGGYGGYNQQQPPADGGRPWGT